MEYSENSGITFSEYSKKSGGKDDVVFVRFDRIFEFLENCFLGYVYFLWK